MAQRVDDFFYLYKSNGNLVHFQLLLSATLIQSAFILIKMLQRTQMFGEMITMLCHVSYQLVKFTISFTLVIVIYLLVQRYLQEQIVLDPEHA